MPTVIRAFRLVMLLAPRSLMNGYESRCKSTLTEAIMRDNHPPHVGRARNFRLAF